MRWSAPLRPILNAGERLLDRALCVIGAALFAQFPEFLQQYLQRLGGHLDEARRQLQQFQQAAAQAGLTLDRFIAETRAQPGPGMDRLGRVMADTGGRVESLQASLAALHDASVWSRPFVFLRHLDPEIARSTLAEFRPAVPTTAEGLVYAAVGMAALLLLYHAGVRYPIKRAWQRRSARRATATS